MNIDKSELENIFELLGFNSLWFGTEMHIYLEEKHGKGYLKTEHTMSGTKTMVVGLLIGVFVMAIMLSPVLFPFLGEYDMANFDFLFFLIAAFGSAAVHEFVHAICEYVDSCRY